MYEYNATILRVIDGDTVEAEVDLGFKIRIREHFRLYGIDAPEMKGETKAAGIASKAHLMTLIEDSGPYFRFFTKKPQLEQDKYGRWLASICGSRDGEDVNLNERMLQDKHAIHCPESWK